MSPRSLHSELMCPICLDMLKNTMTTKECLHRFCADCIITALRSGWVSNLRPLGGSLRGVQLLITCDPLQQQRVSDLS